MTPNEYQALALKTESLNSDIIIINAETGEEYVALKRILHASMGSCTEPGEIMDNIKRRMFYNKEIDFHNLFEEFGDMLWYIAIGLDAIGKTMEECMEVNIAKLKARYGDKFSEEKAVNRDLNLEREVIEHGAFYEGQ